MTDLAIVRQVDLDHDAAIERVTVTLQAEGFGILSTIDMAAKMKEKLGRAMPAYTILGACNPPLAWDAIHAQPDIGVMLPCNVCVTVDAQGRTILRAMRPQVALQLLDDPVLARVAQDATARLERAIAAV